MRVTCPNCLAQYEIDESLLPPEGREVQCSACDHVWFQNPPARKAPSSKPQRSAEDIGLRDSFVVPDDTTGNDDDPLPDMPDPDDDDDAPTTKAGARIFGEGVPQRPKPRALDPAVTDVLREEARFEAEARARDAQPTVETQPDLGLLGGGPWPAFGDPEAQDLNEMPREATGDPTTSALPDIDDVSASLEPLDERRQMNDGDFDLPMTSQDRQRSFLKGFVTPVALGGLVLGLYLAAPLIGAVVPPLAPILQSYIDTVDAGRAAVAALVLGR